MKCRECDGSFEERCEDGISCMVCLKCELLWFSQGQVERAKIRSDKFGKFFKGIEFSGSPIELVDPMCPACDQKLHRHKHATAPHIEVSDCYISRPNCSLNTRIHCC